MNKTILKEVLSCDISERILLVEDIWDSIAVIPDALSVPDAQIEELDRRLDAYHKNPSSGSPWETVKNRILKASF